ncbi:WSC domain-containing protein [Stachybotrys elegans]|uniref:Peroxidase n=1 Tax=Stachybotrys elegans TaxID=80388 RepID=A0A8K0SEB2_9HYPO|nr:WSC domain-containing protein [Stachybotrys elegans]
MKRAVAAVLLPLVSAQLVWPSEWDEIEAVYTMMAGLNRRGFLDAVSPCGFGTNIQGRQNSAEWIRTAFHDMATHDAAAGTGGVDASIFFELDRAENAGSAFNNTFGFFSGFYNTRASASDLIALGVITSTARCGGSVIPFRAGRKDANQAGPAGVPEPQTDLETTLATFNKAGFSEQDMIAMVACGHSLGGVHSVDFPDIVEIPADPENDTSVPFQTDNQRFHNGIVTEFLANTTKNPLVVAANDTVNSDKRIFESDGRKTMQKLAEGDNFQSMCADIFERMINTVPSDVQLTDVIVPYDVKPTISQLSLNDEGNIVFKGDIRLRSTGGIRDPADISVNLVYTDRNGGCNKTSIPTRRVTFRGGQTTGLYDETFYTWEFDAVIDGKRGISKFLVYETIISENKTIIHDNQATGGYPVQDTLLYQLDQSCMGAYQDGRFPLTIAAAVREEEVPGALKLNVVHEVPRQGVIVPELKAELIDFKAGERKNGWLMYRAEASVADTVKFDILSDKDNIAVHFQGTGPLGGC